MSLLLEKKIKFMRSLKIKFVSFSEIAAEATASTNVTTHENHYTTVLAPGSRRGTFFAGKFTAVRRFSIHFSSKRAKNK